MFKTADEFQPHRDDVVHNSRPVWVPPTPEKLAKRFSLILREYLSPEQMKEIIRRNKEETSEGICHSHDFIDANMVMAEAFEELGMPDPDPREDEVTDLWNTAWDIAKGSKFDPNLKSVQASTKVGNEIIPSNEELTQNMELGGETPVLDGTISNPERPNVNAVREALETQKEMEVGLPIEEKQKNLDAEETKMDVKTDGGGKQIIINIASEGKGPVTSGISDIIGVPPNFEVKYDVNGKQGNAKFSSQILADKFIQMAKNKFGKKVSFAPTFEKDKVLPTEMSDNSKKHFFKERTSPVSHPVQCLDCEHVGEPDRHGACANCQSKAVTDKIYMEGPITRNIEINSSAKARPEAYLYKAEFLCEECGEKVKAQLTAEGKAPKNPANERSFDSDDFPKGPYADGGGESDMIQNCGMCHKFLQNPLTQAGYRNLRWIIEDQKRRKQNKDILGNNRFIQEWIDFYPEAFDPENMKKSNQKIAFNLFFPGQALREFRPELHHEIVDYPNATNSPAGQLTPEITGDGGHDNDLESALNLALNPTAIEMVFPQGIQEPLEVTAYVSTSPIPAMGLGIDGKSQVLEGTPLRKDDGIRGPAFLDEYHSQYEGVPGSAFKVLGTKIAAGQEAAQFDEFLKKVCGEIAATLAAAFKVTSRPIMDQVPGEGEVQLTMVEQTPQSSFTTSTPGSRVTYLLRKLTDSQIRDAVEGAEAQAGVWCKNPKGGFVYEVYVRAVSLDTDNTTMKYQFVTGTRDTSSI
jgi:hypothetical protein